MDGVFCGWALCVPRRAGKPAPPQSGVKPPHSKGFAKMIAGCWDNSILFNAMPHSWPHAPAHHFTPRGVYMLTAGTFHKEPLFDTPDRLDLVLGLIFQHATEAGIALQAWAVLSNHYHLVASFEHATLSHRRWITRLHAAIGRELNARDAAPGRRVMYQFWDTELTFEKSWLARLHYVHHNPVHHGVVPVARDYAWCSARWFETNASAAFVKSVCSFKLDRIRVSDDF